MSRLSARVARLDRLTRPRAAADTGARQRLAERVARLLDAADAGDQAAAAQLERIRARVVALTEGRGSP